MTKMPPAVLITAGTLPRAGATARHVQPHPNLNGKNRQRLRPTGALSACAWVMSVALSDWTWAGTEAPQSVPSPGPVTDVASTDVASVSDINDQPTQGGITAGAVNAAEVSLNFRWRHASIEDDDHPEHARAFTLRSRLTYQSPRWLGLTGLFEIDNVTALGAERYDSGLNGREQYPRESDPPGTDMNQLWLGYQREGLDLKLGRQRIQHAEQRFIDSSPWRQNEQTYDSFRAVIGQPGQLYVDYSYAGIINRTVGPNDTDLEPGRLYGDTHLLYSEYVAEQGMTLSGFAYRIDLDDDPRYPASKTVLSSTNTVGFEWIQPLGALRLRLSAAQQTDTGLSPLDYDTYYWVIEGDYALPIAPSTRSGLGAVLGGPWSLRVGHEVLAADNGVGFQTPLGARHKFNGWADLFTNTPPAGLEDSYVALSKSIEQWRVLLRHHHFDASESSDHFGTELNLRLIKSLGAHWRAQAIYADFNSRHPDYSDTRKLWLILELAL